MYYRLLEDHRFPLIEFHTSSCKSQGSLAPSLTTESRLSPGDDFLGIYLGAPTRAHTLTRVHQGRGRRGGTFGAGPLFQPLLLSQVISPSLNSSGGFHNLQCCQRIHERGRESLTDLPPQGKFWPPHHSPARPPRLSPYLAPILEFLYIYDACGIWKTTDKATRGHLSNHLEGRPKLSKVSCLANNLLLQGVEHFFKEWVCWLLPGEEERLILSYNYPLLVICLLEISDDQSYNQIFFNMIWSE